MTDRNEAFAEYQDRRIEWQHEDVKRAVERLVRDVESLASELREGVDGAGAADVNAEFVANRAYASLESLMRHASQLEREARELRVRRELQADYAKAHGA